MGEKTEKIKSMANEKGIFHIFAIDHRDVFVKCLEEKLGHTVTFEEIADEKNRLMEAVSEVTGGYLIDPVYFVKGGCLKARLSGHPFMMGVENSNYDVSCVDDTYLYPDISVHQIWKMGGSMIKLFVYYHPHMEFRHKILEIIRKVETECKKYDMPFLLEPIIYSDHPLNPEIRLSLMKEMLEQLKKVQVDIYKLEFPGDVIVYDDEKNVEICREIGNLIQTPWIVLSSGVSAEVFTKQIALSGQSGASGYAVGRSVWGEYVGAADESLEEMKRIMAGFASTADRYCHPWDRQ